MPIITLTNLTTDPVLLGDLYVTIPPLGSLVVPRAAGELTAMHAMIADIAANRLSLSISYTAAEIAAGFDPYPGLGGGGAGGIVWGAQPWSQVYADLVAAGGKGTVLVVPSGGSHEMTPGIGPTDLSEVLFIGISDSGGTAPTIDIDSLGVGGFQLGGTHNLQSQNVNWQSYYEIGSGQNICWTFDGGSFVSATPANAYRNNVITLVLSHGAVVDGGACAVGLFTVVNVGAVVRMSTGAQIGSQVFSTTKMLPAFPGVNYTRDSSTTVDSNAIVGPGGWLHLPTVWQDSADQVKYDDTAAPPLGALKVQGALDQIKAQSPFPLGAQDFRLGSATGPRILTGAGNPNGVVNGVVGDLYLDSTGGALTTFWVCEAAGLMGWASK